MDKKRIGIYNIYNSSWIAGKYYLDSIVNVLKENKENEIIYISRPSLVYKIIRKTFGRESVFFNKINLKLSKRLNLDYLYPCERYRISAKNNIYWIPDFQENHFPDFFSKNEIVQRLTEQVKIAYSNDKLVLSSESAKNDFERLFPKHTCSLFVLSFITSLYGQKFDENKKVLDKYDINKPFFICSNQFWKHKNHWVVLKAIKEIVAEKKDILVVFTGKEEDYRNPTYVDELKSFVKENNLTENILFLGFISRNDQIDLMNLSIAVLQPSFFEGWNTTIEDAKYLKRKIIASNIEVHHEQLKEKGIYFDCNDYLKLKEILIELQYKKVDNDLIDYEYDKQIEDYKNKINEIFL